MKFSVLQENFSKALNSAARAVGTNPGLPVLSNILIEVIDNKIEFSATDLELGIICWIGAEVESPGKVSVSARTLSEFVNSIGAGKLEVFMEGNILKIKGTNTNASFNIIEADEFPEIPTETDKEILEVNASEFAHAIDKVVFAAAGDDTRPILTGILFESAEKDLSMVGVDGFRLSKNVLKVVNIEKGFSEVIPARVLAEISKVAKDAGEEDVIKMYTVKGNSQVMFKYKDTTFVSRLIEGEYPDYRQILPSKSVLTLSFHKEQFMEAIKIINIFAKSVVGNKTIMSIDTLNAKLTLSANLVEVGANDATVELIEVEGTDMQIGFSAKYLSDMINSMKGDIIKFETNGSTAPGKFSDETDPDYFHIIMPMRLE